ncbi:MAG: ankyrin repeat domain-containing protein, partial [Acidobacteriia bacterium]|nr:ankyrin repeat domain-containing protein [Terriglobia bacterium]
IESLIAQKADLNAPQGDGMTALHWAALKDDVALAKTLIAAGANVAAPTRIGAVTPLFMACTNGSAAMIGELLRAGADPNSAKSNGTTALMIGAESGSVDAVKLLLDRGADANRKEAVHEETALMFAAAQGRAEVIRLLAAKGADVNAADRIVRLARTKYGDISVDPSEKPKPGAGEAVALEDRVQGAAAMGGMTALLFAARDGQAEAVRALVESGANINQPNGSEQTTPLLMAIINGHYDIAKYLLDRGANPNLAAVSGLRPLYATVDVQWAPLGWFPNPITAQESTAYLDLMKALLDNGADPNAKLRDGLWFRPLTHNGSRLKLAGATAFWRAAQANDVAAMRLLASRKADPNLETEEGDTPLMVAAGVGWRGNFSVTAPDALAAAVKYCVEQGADVNAADRRGFSAVHGAAYRGNNEALQFLVEHGAKIDARTKAGDSAADMANGPERFGTLHPETVALARKLGSPFADNCRSAQCLPPPKRGKSAK